ncbi:zinc ABC transporter substrate-binding protein [Aerococcaceae bacterium NML160702]|nr:zinc ABC transporter substrate-binding protein [Aerococcaceae bacterium NML130460]MCW6681265.1 zinc ABC transporter substrate-binding protein [Aerococcaceae bacterium NML160702]
MKKRLIGFFLLVSAILMNSWSPVLAEKKPLTIVTSFYPMYAITQEIVQDMHEVQMIHSSNGIHGYEPSAADIAAIYEADIFIYHSPQLESWTKNLEANKGNYSVHIIQAAAGLEMKKVPGLENITSIAGKDEANLYDPHTWLDPIEAAQEAHLIAEALSEVDSDNAEIYKERAQQFEVRAQKLVETYQPIFEHLEQKTFVTQHTAFYYLAERFGLQQLGIAGISTEQEPSPRKMAEVMQFVERYQVDTIFIEPNVSDKIAKIISEKTGVKLVNLSPLESAPHNDLTFLENLEQQLSVLSQALSK